jgi:hypothetical protein
MRAETKGKHEMGSDSTTVTASHIAAIAAARFGIGTGTGDGVGARRYPTEGEGRMKRRIVPGMLALSLAVVFLAATASTASAERVLSPWYCPPPSTPPTTVGQVDQECLDIGAGSFDFDDRQVGTTSAVQRFALGVWSGPDTFTPDISVSGDYAQTNNCPPTLSVTGDQVQGCQITVTFAPTGTGARHGTLSAGPGAPTVALTGTGVTTPTPWDWPMKLYVFAGAQQELKRGGVVRGMNARTEIGHCHVLGCPDYDSTLVLRGDVKKTTKQLAANEQTRIEARVKHLKRLKEEPTRPKIKIKFTATDEFGQTATEERKVTLCSRLIPGDHRKDKPICQWHPSKK